jgi:hypothetical protein
MSKELVDQITQHLSVVDEIDFINHGGCGYVALAIYDMFVKLGFKPQIIQIDYKYRKTLRSDNIKYRRNNLCMAGVAAHYVVKVGDYFFDSSGGTTDEIRDFSSFSYNKTSIYKSDLIWALKFGGWNIMFKEHNDDNVVRKLRKHIMSFVKSAHNPVIQNENFYATKCAA